MCPLYRFHTFTTYFVSVDCHIAVVLQAIAHFLIKSAPLDCFPKTPKHYEGQYTTREKNPPPGVNYLLYMIGLPFTRKALNILVM